MPDSADPRADEAPPPGRGDWTADYIARATDFWRRAGDASSSTARTWGERSLQDGEWTADTVTADIVETWEALTPLMGEGIELWLELVQRTMNAGRGPGD
jgi:hypothetical protein